VLKENIDQTLKEYRELWFNDISKTFKDFKLPEYICKVYEKTKYDNLTINTLWKEFIEIGMLQVVNDNIFNYELRYKWNKNLIKVFITKKNSDNKDDDDCSWYQFIFDGTENYINRLLKTFGWKLIIYNKDNILFLPIRTKLFDYKHCFLLQNDFITITTNKIKEIKIK